MVFMVKGRYDLFQKAKNLATNVSTNLYLGAASLYGLEQLDKLNYSSSTQALGAAAAGLGIYSLNKSGLMKQFSKKINDSTRKIKGKAMPYIRNGLILPAYIAGGILVNTNNVKDMYTDLYRIGEGEKEIVIPVEPKNKEITSPKKTIEGKFDRAYRWDKTIDEVEAKYKIEKGLLGGLIMRESYGNPLELNETNDGGAGLMMFQPGTAKQYGLKVYGNSSRTGRDINHGKELRNLVKRHNYDYHMLSKLDHRFNVEKSIDAGGKFLSDLKKRHGCWDKALSAYNQGRPAPNPKKTKHVSQVRKYQEYYNQRDKN